MDVVEHFYSDDPSLGPPDAKTTLPGVNYFFLGNGLMQAAVQVCRAKGATPAGLLIMDPEILGPKRKALTFNQRSGIARTMLSIKNGATTHRPIGKSVRARWLRGRAVPTVEVAWSGGPFRVRELFFCPDLRTPRLIRAIDVTYSGARNPKVRLESGVADRRVKKTLTFHGNGRARAVLTYELSRRRLKPTVRLCFGGSPDAKSDAAGYWKKSASVHFSDPTLNRFFEASKFQLRAAVSKSGRLDGGIWQYNLEWVRDQAFIAMALAMSGQPAQARTILDRLFREFVGRDGATKDSSRFRPWQESEFDQNGVLLFALESYVNWTGDTSLLVRHAKRIEKAAAFPLRRAFRHRESGLLRNRREFWERHSVHGIRDGMELGHQLFVAMGLDAASKLALRMGDVRNARAWRKAAGRLKKAVLHDRKYSLIENRRFIKRRDVTGGVQDEIRPGPDSGLPGETPLFQKGRHRLNPDSSAALPIAWGFVDPAGQVSRRTLASLETLWNQRWTGGGYGRYNVTSEPDSPGPWPFPSVFIARAYAETGNSRKVRRVIEWLDGLPGSRSGTWFEFYGPRPVPPYPQVGIVPWVWAELLFLFIYHLLGVRPGATSLQFRPRLLAGLASIEASLPFRGGRLELCVRKARPGERPGYCIRNRLFGYNKNGLEIRLGRDFQEMRAEAVLPRR